MNFFGNRQDEVDQLVKQIIDNLVEQKRIVDNYMNGSRADIAEIREQIDYLLTKRVAKPTIIKTVSKRFSEKRGPTIVNITQTRKVNSTSNTLGKALPGSDKYIYMGPNGGLYYWTNSSSGKRRKTYLTSKQVEQCKNNKRTSKTKYHRRHRRRSKK